MVMESVNKTNTSSFYIVPNGSNLGVFFPQFPYFQFICGARLFTT